jgi:hypothetical protein
MSFVTLMAGLNSTLTGKDSMPRRIRSLMRRTPASVDDFRLRGMSLTLNGVGVMLIASDLAITVVARLALIPPGMGFYTSENLAFPKDTLFLVSTLAAVAALAMFIAAYVLSNRVRYVSTRRSTQTGMPPA